MRIIATSAIAANLADHFASRYSLAGHLIDPPRAPRLAIPASCLSALGTGAGARDCRPPGRPTPPVPPVAAWDAIDRRLEEEERARRDFLCDRLAFENDSPDSDLPYPGSPGWDRDGGGRDDTGQWGDGGESEMEDERTNR